ncbi:MAG: hypothetical protein IPN01_08780 [Deltaproteobacteria bacterium]|nr:hypothetical protein [Deltaproteobacteria bacterium]
MPLPTGQPPAPRQESRCGDGGGRVVGAAQAQVEDRRVHVAEAKDRVDAQRTNARAAHLGEHHLKLHLAVPGDGHQVDELGVVDRGDGGDALQRLDVGDDPLDDQALPHRVDLGRRALADDGADAPHHVREVTVHRELVGLGVLGVVLVPDPEVGGAHGEAEDLKLRLRQRLDAGDLGLGDQHPKDRPRRGLNRRLPHLNVHPLLVRGEVVLGERGVAHGEGEHRGQHESTERHRGGLLAGEAESAAA